LRSSTAIFTATALALASCGSYWIISIRAKLEDTSVEVRTLQQQIESLKQLESDSDVLSMLSAEVAALPQRVLVEPTSPDGVEELHQRISVLEEELAAIRQAAADVSGKAIPKRSGAVSEAIRACVIDAKVFHESHRYWFPQDIFGNFGVPDRRGTNGHDAVWIYNGLPGEGGIAFTVGPAGLTSATMIPAEQLDTWPFPSKKK